MSHAPQLIAIHQLLEEGTEEFQYPHLDPETPIIELRANAASSLWAVGPLLVGLPLISEHHYHEDVMLMITMVADPTGRTVYRCWLISDDGQLVGYYES